MSDDQKQPDTPGIGGETFQLTFDNSWYKPLTIHQVYAYMVECMYGTSHIIDRMVARYESRFE